MNATHIRRRVHASRADVSRALIDAGAVATGMVPTVTITLTDAGGATEVAAVVEGAQGVPCFE